MFSRLTKETVTGGGVVMITNCAIERSRDQICVITREQDMSKTKCKLIISQCIHIEYKIVNS
ncbi:hypothetical protein OUZ56_024279 [Daphnia magna]|uniref:Uncharacterized protein n=1 Tax=Daphnia magna TaxID=35525 RepID=A0ABR0B0I4_9CRUS|nr:hypothetical protein OUZ56_024279 [Daphnia magna]